MRLLLAVDERCNPQATTDYLAARFDCEAVEVDVLSVVPRPRSPVDQLYVPGRTAAQRSVANEIVTAVAEGLSAQHGFPCVRTHVQRGVIADVILGASVRWRSAAVLIGAPREPDLLTTWGFDSVAHAVSTRSPCPVELLRATNRGAHEGNRVLAVVDADRLEDFPFEQLQLLSLAWAEGSLLRIVGVLARTRDVLRNTRRGASRALDDHSERNGPTARLAGVCRALSESFGRRVAVDYRLAAGNTRGVALSSAKRLAPSLLVLDGATADGAPWRQFSGVSPIAITMAAPCSVLLLRSGVPSHRLASALSRP